MTRITWGDQGPKVHSGVDRGVLYTNEVAVAWRGLDSVKTSAEGASEVGSYYDGRKYSNRRTLDETKGVLTAYTYPDEFEDCDGTRSLGPGVLADNQDRTEFDLCYRTTVSGNDPSTTYYYIHLLYSVVASPSDRDDKTISDAINPILFSWDLTVKPLPIEGLRDTAHIIIDTSRISEKTLQTLESRLYGSETYTPTRLPDPSYINSLASANIFIDLLDVTPLGLIPSTKEAFMHVDPPLLRVGESMYWIKTTPSGENTMYLVTGE